MIEKGHTVTENGPTAKRGEEIRLKSEERSRKEKTRSQSVSDGEQCFGLELFSNGLLDLGVGLEGGGNGVSEGRSAR